MIKKIITQEEYTNMLRYMFSEDKPLLSKFHVWAGNGIDACVYKTAMDLVNGEVTVHGLYSDDKLVAYFGEQTRDGMPYMTGWAIHPSFRKDDIKDDFWNEIKTHFGKDFLIGVFNRNERAIKFLTKRGCYRYDFVFTPEGIGEFYKCEVK